MKKNKSVLSFFFFFFEGERASKRTGSRHVTRSMDDHALEPTCWRTDKHGGTEWLCLSGGRGVELGLGSCPGSVVWSGGMFGFGPAIDCFTADHSGDFWQPSSKHGIVA